MSIQTAGHCVALMQPTFLPWMGYFSLLKQADRFVFLDDFQFVRRSFHSRNNLFIGRDNVKTLSLPVEHGRSQQITLDQVRPVYDKKWENKFYRTLEQSYGFSRYLEEVIYILKSNLSKCSGKQSSLAELNMNLIKAIAALLGIDTQFELSSKYSISGTRSEKIIGLLKATNAQQYLSAFGSFDYMNSDKIFDEPLLVFLFQNFQPASYPQIQSSKFVSHLSILDCILQVGPNEAKEVMFTSERPPFSIMDMRRRSESI